MLVHVDLSHVSFSAMNNFLDLSNTSARVLDVYRQWRDSRRGCPTYSEIGSELGISSRAVAEHVGILLTKKYVTRRAGRERNIVLTDKA